MASGLYENGVKALMGGDIDLINSTIAAVLVDSTEYTVDLANDVDISDVGEDAILKEATLTGKTLDGTTFRADSVTFASVTADNADAVVLFLDATTDAGTILIAYLDNAPEFPAAPSAEDVIINWDSGANGIFKL